MEIRTLRYFLAVAREENMSRAAEQLHVTQPTLSKALKSLEDELGKKLFSRHSFSIALTEEGELLRSRAEDLLSMADKIEQEFSSLATFISALPSPIRSAVLPERSMRSKSSILTCATISQAAIRSRSRKSWTRACWISP